MQFWWFQQSLQLKGKIKVFWNKVYDLIIFVNDVKFLSHELNYIVMLPCDQSLVTLAFPREKFGNSSISKREVIRIWTEKKAFFEECPWFRFNDLGLALGMAFKFYTSVANVLKLKVGKFYGIIPTFVEVTGEKLVEGEFCLPFTE